MMRNSMARKHIPIVLLLTAVFMLGGFYLGKKVVCCHCRKSAVSAQAAPQSNMKPYSPIITWPQVDLAVCYEFELLGDIAGLSPKERSTSALFTTTNVYTNAYNVNLEPFIKLGKLYYRARALNIDKKPISDFTAPVEIKNIADTKGYNYPQTMAASSEDKGSTLLYPVYAWIPMNGAAKYEVEVLDRPPENPEGIAPSRYRIWHKETTLSDLYDEAARTGPKPFYWRVRAMDDNNQPMGTYSPAVSFTTDPREKWEVGVLGDSISHGGGDMSYSPADLSYSWIHYLDKPAINLSYSGDTSATMRERFDKDVLPFSPKYLLIMGGTNSIRAGVPAQEVIGDLNTIKEKCLTNHIEPIFLTLLPVNPDNIARCFDEPTDENWQDTIAEVNSFIRTQNNIDVAAAMPFDSTLLPTEMGIDGLHANADAKKIIGAAVNANWDQTVASLNHEQNQFFAQSWFAKIFQTT